MIRLMVQESMSRQLELAMMDNGFQIKGMEKVKNNGQMVLHFKALMYQIKKMVQESLNGRMEISMLGNFGITESMDKD